MNNLAFDFTYILVLLSTSTYIPADVAFILAKHSCMVISENPPWQTREVNINICSDSLLCMEMTTGVLKRFLGNRLKPDACNALSPLLYVSTTVDRERMVVDCVSLQWLATAFHSLEHGSPLTRSAPLPRRLLEKSLSAFLSEVNKSYKIGYQSEKQYCYYPLLNHVLRS